MLYSKIERINKDVNRLSKELNEIKFKSKSKSRKPFLIKEIRRNKRIIRNTEKIIMKEVWYLFFCFSEYFVCFVF